MINSVNAKYMKVYSPQQTYGSYATQEGNPQEQKKEEF